MKRSDRRAAWSYATLLTVLLAMGGCGGSVGEPRGREKTADVPRKSANDARRTVSTAELGAVARGYRKSVAIVVGIDQYPEPFAQLKRAVNDARSVRNILINELGYLPSAVKLLENRQATRRGIEEALSDWLASQRLNADDSVLFYFAGHGESQFLAAADSRKKLLEATWLPVDAVVRALDHADCRHKLVILASCYSGGIFTSRGGANAVPPMPRVAASDPPLETRGDGSSWEEDALAGYFRAPSFLAITAARDTVAADGMGKDGHSLFTWALLESIKERAQTDRSDQVFLGRMLANDVERRVMAIEKSPQCVGWGYLTGQDGGDFVFRPTTLRKLPKQVSEERRRQLKVRTFVRDLAAAKQSLDQGDAPAALRKLEPHLQDPELRSRFEGRFLRHLAEQGMDAVTQVIDDEPWLDMAVSQDGTRLLTAHSREAALWDLPTRRKLRAAKAQRAGFVSQGTHVLVSSHKHAEIWDAAGVPLPELTHLQAPPLGSQNLLASLDGSAFLRRQDTLVAVYDGTTFGKRFVTDVLDSGRENIGCMAIAPDASTIAIVSSHSMELLQEQDPTSHVGPNFVVSMFDGNSGAELGVIEVGQFPVSDLAFSPDGRHLAVALGRAFGQPLAPEVSRIDVWNARTAALEQSLNGFRHGNDAVAFSPDGATLAVGGNPDAGFEIVQTVNYAQTAYVAFFDLWSGQESFRIRVPPRDRDVPQLAVVDLQFLPGNDGLLVNVPPLEIWTAAGDEPTDPAKGTATIAPRVSRSSPRRHSFSGAALALSQSGRRLLTLDKVKRGRASTARLWDLDNNAMVDQFDVGAYPTAVISPDGSKFVAFNPGDQGQVFRTGSKQGLPMAGPPGDLQLAAFSPDATVMATASVANGSDDWSMSLWNPDNGRRTAVFDHPEWVNALAFDATGERVATYSIDSNRLRLWNVSTQQLIVEHSCDSVTTLAFSPRGDRIAASGHYLLVFGVREGEQGTTIDNLATVVDFSAIISVLAYNTSGELLAAGLEDGRIALVDKDFRIRRVLTGVHRKRIVGVAFRTDHELVTACEDGIVGVWPLPKLE